MAAALHGTAVVLTQTGTVSAVSSSAITAAITDTNLAGNQNPGAGFGNGRPPGQ